MIRPDIIADIERLSVEIAEAVMGNRVIEGVFGSDTPEANDFRSDIQIEAARVLKHGGAEIPIARTTVVWDGDLGRCPSCKAANVFMRQPYGDARHHVQCRICDMRGPVRTEAGEAAKAWNSLPRSLAPLPAGTVTEEMKKVAVEAFNDAPHGTTTSYVYAALEAAFAARPAEPVAVKVKTLEWRDHRGHTFPDTWTALSPLGGVFEIEERSASDSPAYVASGPNYVFIADKDSLDAAKAAAQADYEARIRSALVSTPAPGLVEALEVARRWLANSMPIVEIDGPKPLPLIDAAPSITETGGAK